MALGAPGNRAVAQLNISMSLALNFYGMKAIIKESSRSVAYGSGASSCVAIADRIAYFSQRGFLSIFCRTP